MRQADKDRPVRTDDLGERAFQLTMALRTNAAYSSNPVEYAQHVAECVDAEWDSAPAVERVDELLGPSPAGGEAASRAINVIEGRSRLLRGSRCRRR